VTGRGGDDVVGVAEELQHLRVVGDQQRAERAPDPVAAGLPARDPDPRVGDGRSLGGVGAEDAAELADGRVRHQPLDGLAERPPVLAWLVRGQDGLPDRQAGLVRRLLLRLVAVAADAEGDHAGHRGGHRGDGGHGPGSVPGGVAHGVPQRQREAASDPAQAGQHERDEQDHAEHRREHAQRDQELAAGLGAGAPRHQDDPDGHEDDAEGG
jgi:hypothetical protein